MSEAAVPAPDPAPAPSGGPKKSFSHHTKAHDGIVGVLVTADRGREDRCAREIIDLFEEVAERYYPLDGVMPINPAEDGSKTMTLEMELKKELSILRKSKKKRSKRFHSVPTDCKNMVLIRFMDDINPSLFIPKVFEHLVNEVKRPRTRYSNRILPLELTSNVSEQSIINAITPSVERVFRTENVTKRPYKFRVDLRVRNNDKLNKEVMKQKLVGVVGKGHFVDLKTPHQVLIVEIFCKIAGVSVVDGVVMEKYHGFNIRTVSDKFGVPLTEEKKAKNEPKPKKEEAPQKMETESESEREEVDDEAKEHQELQETPSPQPMEESAPLPVDVELEFIDFENIPVHDECDPDNGGISMFSDSTCMLHSVLEQPDPLPAE